MLLLKRVYLKNATHGEFIYNNKLIAYTIELPWKNNEKRISCIPEGCYNMRRRYSEKFGWHLVLLNVENRSMILIHPANDALKELQGCIAPVSKITDMGKGTGSRKAMELLLDAVNLLKNTKEGLALKIVSENTR